MMNWLYDNRTECHSVLTMMSVREYLDLVKPAHESKGSLSGQRDTLKTTTAKRIRDRMVEDIRRGAVLPPLVIGATVPEAIFARLPAPGAQNIASVLPQKSRETLSIIDGMQRTSALAEAAQIEPTVLDRSVRVEFWITQNVQSMVYRMLVLNTGQVPWTLSRQLSVVFSPLISEITSSVPEIDRVFTPDEPGKRIKAGQFGSETLVELYIAFSLRKTAFDTKEALSDEFSRLDFVENLSERKFQSQFYSSLDLLVQLDKSFSRFDSGKQGRFSKGRNIFDSQPARIGFMSSLAQHVLGRPGMDRTEQERSDRMQDLTHKAINMANGLNALETEGLGKFLKLDVLAETLEKRVGQVGRYERSVFFDAFRVLIEEDFDVPNMEPCWRAN